MSKRDTLIETLQRAPLILTATDLRGLARFAKRLKSKRDRWARVYVAELVAARRLAVEAKRKLRARNKS